MIDKKILEQGEKFKELCLEILPLVEKISGLLVKHEVEKLTSLTISADGYMNYSTHESDWVLVRIDKNSPVKLSYKYREEINLEEGK